MILVPSIAIPRRRGLTFIDILVNAFRGHNGFSTGTGEDAVMWWLQLTDVFETGKCLKRGNHLEFDPGD